MKIAAAMAAAPDRSLPEPHDGLVILRLDEKPGPVKITRKSKQKTAEEMTPEEMKEKRGRADQPRGAMP